MLAALDLTLPDWCPTSARFWQMWAFPAAVPHTCPLLAGMVFPSIPLFWAVGVTLAFAWIAYRLHGVTISGATAGAAVAFVLLYVGGPGVFSALVALFVITSASTRLGYHRKQRLGIAESRRGRNAGQVLANLSVAAVCIFVSSWVPHPSPILARVGVFACIAALAEAAADTVSSECGEAWSDTAYLVTSFRPVPPGTNGAVSVPGTVAGAVAAALVAATAGATRLLTSKQAALAALAGFLGSLLDSLLGATLERRRLLGNNAVNFLSTLAAALLAVLMGLAL